eukprot:COSAG06_NODE_22386_length_725_cov_0.968051_2_plen_43_part_01
MAAKARRLLLGLSVVLLLNQQMPEGSAAEGLEPRAFEPLPLGS